MEQGEIEAIQRVASLYLGPGDRSLVDHYKVNVPRFPTVRYNALALCGPAAREGRIATHRRLRSSLLATARKLIAQGGTSALNIRALADIHGISRPTIYNCVGSRADILQAAIDELLAANATIALRCSEAKAINPILTLAETLWFTIALDEDYARQMIFAVHELRRNQGPAIVYRPLHAHIVLSLQSMAKQDRLRPALIQRTARTLLQHLIASLTEWAEEPAGHDELYRDIMWGMLLPLLGVVDESERRWIRDWLTKCENGAQMW